MLANVINAKHAINVKKVFGWDRFAKWKIEKNTVFFAKTVWTKQKNAVIDVASTLSNESERKKS